MKATTWLLCLTGVYALVLVTISVLNRMGPDFFWLGALNLYLPQVMWAVPGLILFLAFFKLDRSWMWLPLLCVLWVLGPLMGFSWSLPAPKSATAGLTIRVMTWNVKYGRYDIAALLEELTRHTPDVVLLQDAPGSMRGPLKYHFREWHTRSFGQYVIASKYPLFDAEVHELPSSSHREENFLRCRMRIGSELISLYNVHFKTPRRSLNAFRTARRQPWYLPEAINYFDRNVRLRLVQAATMVEHLNAEQGPVIVAGDLNAPEASLVCATLREAGLRDAFSEGGTGYGFTYGHLLLKNRLPWLRISWMRIDHIMLNSRFTTQRAWTGSGQASDHRPVIADLVLNYP